MCPRIWGVLDVYYPSIKRHMLSCVFFGTDPVTGKRRRKTKLGIHSMATAREVEKEMRTSVNRLFNQETVTFDELFEQYVNRVNSNRNSLSTALPSTGAEKRRCSKRR